MHDLFGDVKVFFDSEDLPQTFFLMVLLQMELAFTIDAGQISVKSNNVQLPLLLNVSPCKPA